MADTITLVGNPGDDGPNLMDMSGPEFESLITNLFMKMGLESRQTQASRDGGVDCVAYDPRPIFGGKVVIQAKRYKHTVGVSAVRDLYGTMQNEGASKGILVTTSGYGKASFEFADGKPIELLSGPNLLYLLEEHMGLKARIGLPDPRRIDGLVEPTRPVLPSLVLVQSLLGQSERLVTALQAVEEILGEIERVLDTCQLDPNQEMNITRMRRVLVELRGMEPLDVRTLNSAVLAAWRLVAGFQPTAAATETALVQSGSSEEGASVIAAAFDRVARAVEQAGNTDEEDDGESWTDVILSTAEAGLAVQQERAKGASFRQQVDPLSAIAEGARSGLTGLAKVLTVAGIPAATLMLVQLGVAAMGGVGLPLASVLKFGLSVLKLGG